MAIKLKEHQEEAVKFAIKEGKVLLALATGQGKTFCSVFTLRYLLNKDLTDKVIIACTKSSLSPFIKDLKKVKVVPSTLGSIEDLSDFLESDKDKVALIKHNFIIEMGFSLENIKLIRKQNKRITVIIDEAHLLSNCDSKAHQAYDHIRDFFHRVILLTATPYSSTLEQIFGLVHLIQPETWEDIKEFKRLFCEYKAVKDWKTGKFKYNDLIRYINLPLLRKTLEKFTFFYFPKINLHYVNHTCKLKDYSYYDDLAQGILKPEDLLERKV